MSGGAYYNEIDRNAAAWLRELIAEGLIPAGEVDERSIVDVRPADLSGFSQCHFFAGIGGWPLALQLAGWGDGPVWTGSCPCQPFSAAGAGGGFADERHLWPAWHALIRECRPAIIFGEQVASKGGLGWFDSVHADLEGEGYAVGAADLCAASVGAPHIRQRLYFGARLTNGGLDHATGARYNDEGQHDGRSPLFAARPIEPSSIGRLANAQQQGREGRIRGGADEGGQALNGYAGRSSPNSGLADADSSRFDAGRSGQEGDGGNAAREQSSGFCDAGQWANPQWLACKDGKLRPTQPGLFPLAHGVSGRVALLRGAGNAIVPQVAAAFVEAFIGGE